MAIGHTLHTPISYRPMIYYYYYHHGPILLKFTTAVDEESRQRLWRLTDNNYTSCARITTYKCHYDHSSDAHYNILLHICTYIVRLCRVDLSIKVFMYLPTTQGDSTKKFILILFHILLSLFKFYFFFSSVIINKYFKNLF